MACHLEFPELTTSWCDLSCCHGIANVLWSQGAGLAWPIIRIWPFAVYCRYFSIYCMMETGSSVALAGTGYVAKQDIALQVLRLWMYCHHAKFRWQNPVPATQASHLPTELHPIPTTLFALVSWQLFLLQDADKSQGGPILILLLSIPEDCAVLACVESCLLSSAAENRGWYSSHITSLTVSTCL